VTDIVKLFVFDIRVDGGTQPRATLREEWMEEYAADMAMGSKFPPVVVFHDGEKYWLGDGFHRLGAAKKLGHVTIDADVRQGTRRDAVLFSVGANGLHGHRRTNEDKRRAVMMLLGDPEWRHLSDREVARHCAVSQPFVSSLREPSDNGYQIQEPSTRTVTRGDTTYMMNVGNIGTRATLPFATPLPDVYAPVWTPDDVMDEADAETRHIDSILDAELEPEAETPHNHRAQGTGENEWYTPSDYIEAARTVLGTIDLDPASSLIANKTVKASQFFSIEDDGLTSEWYGKVWCNPPYAQPWIKLFAEKICEEVRSNRVLEAIMLTHNYTDTTWFHIAAQSSSAICFTRGRIGFLSPEGKKAAPTQGQAFFYFGKNILKFAEKFAVFGFVMVKHEF